MASFQAPGTAPQAGAGDSTAPMVALFERDDEIAVPLLSQVRMAGYDVRAARTAVELFDVLAKNPVALVLIDLGGATASRREFWVALDARRRGRTLQVMTFRIKDAHHDFAGDETTVRALADVEVLGPGDFPQIIEGIRAHVPLHGAQPNGAPVAIGTLPPGMKVPSDASSQFGQALGAMSSFMPAFSSTPPGSGATLFGEPLSGLKGSTGAYDPGGLGGNSPFAHPAQGNPFASSAGSPLGPALPGAVPGSSSSPFAQPLAANPFASAAGLPGAAGSDSPEMNPFGVRSSWSDPFGASAPPTLGGSAGAAPGPGFGPLPGPISGGLFDRNGWGAGSAPSRPGASQARGATSQPGAFGASNPSGRTGAQPSIADRWTPPDQGAQSAAAAERAFEQQETSVAPEVAFHAPEPERATGQVPVPSSGWIAQVQAAAAAGGIGGKPLSPADEKALSDVLVEGALLSPQTLEVLRGVQQMLSTVDMKLNVGELAMIFNFLTQDQYLAALLVSRGLVSPAQIASLGRVKQEMAAAGQDYDLAELLVKFKVLSADQLARIQSELGHH